MLVVGVCVIGLSSMVSFCMCAIGIVSLLLCALSGWCGLYAVRYRDPSAFTLCAIGMCAIGMCAIGHYGQFTVCYRDVCYRTVRYRIPLSITNVRDAVKAIRNSSVFNSE